VRLQLTDQANIEVLPDGNAVLMTGAEGQHDVADAASDFLLTAQDFSVNADYELTFHHVSAPCRGTLFAFHPRTS